VTIQGGSASAAGLAAGATGASTAGLGQAGPGLTSCGLAVAIVPAAPPSVTCAGANRSAAARGLIPVALGVAGGSVTQEGVVTGPGAGAAAGAPGGLLASTGTPLVAGLAGLALLMVGGFLTWKRARD